MSQSGADSEGCRGPPECGAATRASRRADIGHKRDRMRIRPRRPRQTPIGRDEQPNGGRKPADGSREMAVILTSLRVAPANVKAAEMICRNRFRCAAVDMASSACERLGRG